MAASITELISYQAISQYLERDNDVPWDKVECHLAKYGDEVRPGPGNPYISEPVAQKFTNWLLSLIQSSSINSDLKEFELKAYNKWFGPQGATPSKSQVYEALWPYYERVPKRLVLPKYSEYVVAEFFKDVVFPVLHTLRPCHELWHDYSGDHKSNSGVTSWSDRRELSARKKAIKLAFQIYTGKKTLQPVVVGTRNQRNKVCRAIFMDAFSNYFVERAAFGFVEQIFKNSNHIAWRGDAYVENYVQSFLAVVRNPVFFESDYETMDTWVALQHFKWLLQLFKDAGVIDESLHKYALRISEQLFKVDLLVPDGVIHKHTHNLFSGIYPTNPMESPLNLYINIDFVQSLNRNLVLDKDYILVVLGDDVLIVFNKDSLDKYGVSYTELPKRFAKFSWDQYRLKALESKQRVSLTSGFFCKRQYRNRGRGYYAPALGKSLIKSVYPLILVWNSIKNPEEGMHARKVINLISLWAKCDNAYGHPLWKQFVLRLFDILGDQYKGIEVADADVEEFNSESKSRSWRVRFYGEEFSVDKSPSAQLWIKQASVI
jgi:hypothetical protein